jgi:hypothetical protein
VGRSPAGGKAESRCPTIVQAEEPFAAFSTNSTSPRPSPDEFALFFTSEAERLVADESSTRA